ncbi:MAG: hypothetical protein ABW043_16895 [Devosia sp.]|uniref:hypothetical protein n=1 Tax=Devosia sp. TaxID=1871048 RepID=UPI00339369A7
MPIGMALECAHDGFAITPGIRAAHSERERAKLADNPINREPDMGPACKSVGKDHQIPARMSDMPLADMAQANPATCKSRYFGGSYHIQNPRISLVVTDQRTITDSATKVAIA